MNITAGIFSLAIFIMVAGPVRGMEFTNINMGGSLRASGHSLGEYDLFNAAQNPSILADQPRVFQLDVVENLMYGGEQNAWGLGFGWMGKGVNEGCYGTALLLSGARSKPFDVTDSSGNNTGEKITPSGYMADLLLAYRWRWLGVGVSGGFAVEDYDYSGADAGKGLPYSGGFWLDMSRFVRAGMSFRGDAGPTSTPLLSVGGALRFNTFIKGSIGAEVTYPVMAASDQGTPYSGLFTGGISLIFGDILTIRAGMKTTGSYDKLPITAGIGAAWKEIKFNYALDFEGAQALGYSHMVGLGWSFGAERRLFREKVASAVSQPQFEAQELTGKPTLAVAQFEPQGVSASDAAVISDMFRTELVKRGTFSIIEKANMDKVLQEQSFQQTGCTSQECVVKLGKIMNVKYMVVGSFGKLLSQYVLGFRVIDVETARVIYSDDQKGLSDQQAVANAISELARRLDDAVAKKK